jgi:hypothetical protein
MSYSTYAPPTRLLSRAAILLTVALAGSFMGVSAQARDGDMSPALQLSLDACARRQGSTPEARIASCSEAMDSVRLVTLDRADAYLSRSEAYMATGNHQRALSDYRESVKLRALHDAGV